jgi:tRNA-Thr(GGU) m(6)t(6)A37 methyltransferase TsaA
MTGSGPRVTPIGRVESPLVALADAPKQGDEGAPAAWLVFAPEVAAGLRGLVVGTEVVVLTWLDRARRDVLMVHPRDDPSVPERGVFGTRSADRPNPIGLHTARIVRIDGIRIQVCPLEAVHGTPVLDLKPVLPPVDER